MNKFVKIEQLMIIPEMTWQYSKVRGVWRVENPQESLTAATITGDMQMLHHCTSAIYWLQYYTDYIHSTALQRCNQSQLSQTLVRDVFNVELHN